MCVNVDLVYARGIAYPLVHNQFVNKGSQWVMLKRTVANGVQDGFGKISD